MKYNIHSIDLREGKYEILYEVLDDGGNLIVGNLIHSMTDKYPSSEDLDNEFNNVIFKRVDHKFLEDSFIPDKYYSSIEITRILRNKNYLSDEEEFSEDMPVKQIIPIII